MYIISFMYSFFLLGTLGTSCGNEFHWLAKCITFVDPESPPTSFPVDETEFQCSKWGGGKGIKECLRFFGFHVAKWGKKSH